MDASIIDHLSPIPDRKRGEEFRFMTKLGVLVKEGQIVPLTRHCHHNGGGNHTTMHINLHFNPSIDNLVINYLVKCDSSGKKHGEILRELAKTGLDILVGRDVDAVSLTAHLSNDKPSPNKLGVIDRLNNDAFKSDYQLEGTEDLSDIFM